MHPNRIFGSDSARINFWENPKGSKTILLNNRAGKVQGTAADITKKALGLLPRRLVDTGAQIIGTVHDEIIIEVPYRLTGEAAVILKKSMIQAGKAYVSKVPVDVDVTIGETWEEK